jgi:hypothetical protein
VRCKVEGFLILFEKPSDPPVEFLCEGSENVVDKLARVA